jgi:integrase
MHCRRKRNSERCITIIGTSAPRRETLPNAQNAVSHHFKLLLGHAGLPPICWHDLRHTCATLLLGRGVHPKLVQQLLGHASITMTLDRYSHWIPSMGRHAADGMDKALG